MLRTQAYLVQNNPVAAFDLADAGGKEVARERALSRVELVRLFEAMRNAKGFTYENALTVVATHLDVPEEAATRPESSETRCMAMVVEPISQAMP